MKAHWNKIVLTLGIILISLGSGIATASTPTAYEVIVVNDTEYNLIGISGLFSNVDFLPYSIKAHEDGAITVRPGSVKIDFRYAHAITKRNFPVLGGVNFTVTVEGDGIVTPKCNSDIMSNFNCHPEIMIGGASLAFTTIFFYVTQENIH